MGETEDRAGQRRPWTKSEGREIRPGGIKTRRMRGIEEGVWISEV